MWDFLFQFTVGWSTQWLMTSFWTLKYRQTSLHWSCHWTQVWLLNVQKPIIQEESVNKRNRCFTQKSQESGEKMDSWCPKTSSKGFAQPWQFLKGKMRWGWRISVNHPGRSLGSALSSITYGLTGSVLALSSDVTMPKWSAFRIAKGVVGVDSKPFFNYIVLHSHSFYLGKEPKG